MTKYTPTMTEHDEFLDGFKYPAGIITGSVAMLGTFTLALDHTPQGERFRHRQELTYHISDLEGQQVSLNETLNLLPQSNTPARNDITTLIESTSAEIAEVRTTKEDIGNVYVDNTELIAGSLLVGALLGRVVFMHIDKKVRRRSPDYKPY